MTARRALNKNLDGIDRIYVRAIFADADGGQRIQVTNVSDGFTDEGTGPGSEKRCAGPVSRQQ